MLAISIELDITYKPCKSEISIQSIDDRFGSITFFYRHHILTKHHRSFSTQKIPPYRSSSTRSMVFRYIHFNRLEDNAAQRTYFNLLCRLLVMEMSNMGVLVLIFTCGFGSDRCGGNYTNKKNT